MSKKTSDGPSMMRSIIDAYAAAFDAKDKAALLSCVSDDVAYDVDEGTVRYGKSSSAALCAHISRCCDEVPTYLVIFEAIGQRRAAAEIIVNGRNLATDTGRPEACDQTGHVPAGSFFETTDGKFTRVTTVCTLKDWVAQVSGVDGA